MAQTDDSATTRPEPDDDDSLRKRLLQRVTIAGAVVIFLLAVLALFDSLYVQQPEKPAMNVATTAPVAEEKPGEAKSAEADEEKPAESPESPAAPATPVAEKDVAAEPERTAEPTGTLPAARVERPLTVPATAHPAMLRPAEPAPVVEKPEPAKEVARVVPVPAGTSGKPAAAPAKPAVAETKGAPAPGPIARAVEAAGQFLLQMGVFSSVANAEELRARLELAGVPAHIEARVQVGPFATRQEAEQAREKLKSLGMDPGLIMAARK